MSEVASLITKGNVSRVTSQKEIKMRLSWCLEQLNAKLNENRILKNTGDIKDKRQLQSLESELTAIKMEVVKLKEALLELNKGRASDLKRSMKKLDGISFKRFDGFDRKERIDLQKSYEGFKEITRRGNDGAVELMELIMKVEAIEKTKEGDDRLAVQEVERTALATIADIYSGLFSSKDRQSKMEETPHLAVTVNQPPKAHEEARNSMDVQDISQGSQEPKTTEMPLEEATTDAPVTIESKAEPPNVQTEARMIETVTDAAAREQSDDVTAAAGASSDSSDSKMTSLPRPIIRRSTKDVRVPEVPKSSLPKFPSDTEMISETGGGGSDGDNGFGDGDPSDDDEPEAPKGFLLVFGILLILVSIVIFLPEDKTEAFKKLKFNKLKEWFDQTTGSKPKVDDKKKKTKKKP